MSAKVLATVGAVLLVAGFLVGFIPVSSGGVNCGSAFAASDEADIADMVNAMNGQVSGIAAQCESLRSIVAIPSWVLLGIGALLLLLSLVWAGKASEQTRNQTGSAR
jgi:hypothetical protein